MKSVILAILIASTGMSSALAEDLSKTKSSYDWSGFFVGATLGGGWGSDTYHYSSSSVDIDTSGAVGGLSAGYDWQAGQLVFGTQIDASLSSIEGQRLVTPFAAPCGNEGCSADIDWYGTVRARAGYAFDNIMPYLTGGAAVGRVKGTADLGACGFTSTCRYEDTRWGWSAGAGVEWGIAQNLSMKVEYLHVDLGTPEFSSSSADPSTDRIDFDTVRLGLNVRF